MLALRLFICTWLCAVLAACAGAPTQPASSPSHDRDWQGYVARLPTVEWQTRDRFALRNVRNWTWDANGPVREDWETRQHDINDLQAIWYFVEPFPRAPSFAHTFLTFEFAEGAHRRFLTVSVEARREKGEEYSVVAGMQGAYELIFAWSTERDILTDSVLRFGYKVQMYRTNVEPHQARRILRAFLSRTQEIARQPQSYNTLRHNCTTELAAVVNREFSDPIPWDSSFVFTAHSAEYLHRLGYLGDTDLSFWQVRAEARISQAVRHLANQPERRFSSALRVVMEDVVRRKRSGAQN